MVNIGLTAIFCCVTNIARLCNNFFEGLNEYTGEDPQPADKRGEDTAAPMPPSHLPGRPSETLLASWEQGEM